MDDNKIIELFFERSENALTEISEKYSKICCKIAFNILGNESDAQECVNDAFLGIWNTIPPECPDKLSAFLYKVVRNVSLKKLRSNTAKKRNSHYDSALDEIEGCLPSEFKIEDELNAEILSAEINKFLANLSKENRIIFVKRYWFGEEISEIARNFNITNHNITVKLSRIRKALKKHLIEEGYDI